MIKYLLGRASTGKFRFAVVECDEEWHSIDDGRAGYIIQRSYGQVRGKTTLSPQIIVDRTKQKRNWQEQYTLQFNSEVKKYLDKGYKEIDKHPNEYTDDELLSIFGDVKTNQYGVIKPQLAKQADKVTNPKIFNKEWLISRKLDGVKALFYWDGKEIHTASRGGEHYDYSTTHLRTNPSLVAFFKENPTIILDGELFVRGKTLQQISGAARMEKNAYDCDWLQYWIYDCYDSSNIDMPAKDRYTDILINKLNKSNGIFVYMGIDDDEISDSIRILHHEYVTGWDNMKALHDKWVAEGFEGAVITDPSKPYKVGSRCNNLIKIKQYKSEDFKVIGYKLGLRGSEDMTFTCELEDGRTFEAMPVGNREIKAEYVENFETKYKGHKAECTFFNYSDDGIPTQPKLRIFRFDLE
nr:MAG TPA: adenylation DNA ligase-like protein [Crassvirales sp.]